MFNKPKLRSEMELHDWIRHRRVSYKINPKILLQYCKVKSVYPTTLSHPLFELNEAKEQIQLSCLFNIMVFKPWDAIGAQPRHILNDVPLSLKSHSLPIIKIIADENIEGTLLVLPYTLKSVFEALIKESSEIEVGKIEIWSSYTNGYDIDEEFVEEEQLYKIKDNEEEIEDTSRLTSTIQIMKASDNFYVLYVDNYQNEQIINYNLIAKEIIKTFKSLKLLSFTPGNLPFQSSVCKLNNDISDDLPFEELVPPFYITGISGSILSQEKVLNKKNSATVLILQSEGVPGFEKVDLESIREVSFWLKKKFQLSKKFVENVENLVGIGKNVNNFALYL